VVGTHKEGYAALLTFSTIHNFRSYLARESPEMTSSDFYST
jgi:hypothetical protein